VNLDEIMNNALISDADLARAAGLSEKTIKTVKAGKGQSRMRTKRAALDGLNRLLSGLGHQVVGPEIFSLDPSPFCPETDPPSR
jgi:hypothetical protein